ncbi:MAG: hypothetical protein EBT42_08095 [Actinobacteria bacterium]|jgi:hypothetical protein|nr:hypothetical protein [Actinomycetota bacterium]
MNDIIKQDMDRILTHSLLYKNFLSEREEILKHKWIESQKYGYDIGFERALIEWNMKHRLNWMQSK